MFNFLLWLVLGLTQAHAQNPMCPTRPGGDSTNACASTAFVNGATGNILPVPAGGTGGGSFIVNNPILGNGTSPFIQGTRSGNTTGFLTFSGTLTNGNCPTFNSGNIIDSGAPCATGTGSGTVAAGLANQLAYYAANGTTVTGTFAINIPATAKFYQSTGASIQRLNDRLFVGGATGNTGNAQPSSGDWWCNATPTTCSTPFAQMVVEYDITNPNASLNVPMIAVSAAVEAINAPSGGAGATPRALEGIAYNNPSNVASNASVWGLYVEGHYISGAGAGQNTFGIEDEVRAASVVSTTFTPFTAGAGAGLHALALGCGAGLAAANTCTDAMYITANPNQFAAGIVFLNGSIAQDATGGTTVGAIEMPTGYSIQWYNAGTGAINATVMGDGAGNLVIATNGSGGHLFVNGTGSTHQVFCGSGATTAC